ncbi:hypothetical protein DB346_07675 [Verrucomicrobia bacterium LW23]|nr:hypothetical protein DB346_07675 [Verrucomicrobia bacterium LW23]
MAGYLNRHGYLRGYDVEAQVVAEAGGDLASARMVRGWRVFCSNRRRRAGCGRTHPVLRAGVLWGRVATALLLWKFLLQMLLQAGTGAGRAASKAPCVATAWRLACCNHVVPPLSGACGCRLWRVWRWAQPWIRSCLCRRGTSPPVSGGGGSGNGQRDPLIGAIEDLRQVFAGQDVGSDPSFNPIAAFQLRFQRPFFPQ